VRTLVVELEVLDQARVMIDAVTVWGGDSQILLSNFVRGSISFRESAKVHVLGEAVASMEAIEGDVAGEQCYCMGMRA
jgi:hypothetical protein